MENVGTSNQPTLSKFRVFGSSILGFITKLAKDHYKFRAFQSLNGLVGIGSVISFLLAISLAYLFVYPRFQPAAPAHEFPKSINPIETCNFFKGKWILDEAYPLYNASECPFAERGFNCIANGRGDTGYMKWKWKPKDCDIPKFDMVEILESLRGKRIVFVGDSLSRTQWESMICLLMTGVEDKRSVYEVNQNKITKRIRYLGVRFGSVNLSIEFYRSVFLVQLGPATRRAPRRVKSTLILDKLDDISEEWIDSDVLVFNSGHWWTPTKLFEMGCYFQTGGSLKLGMSITSAYRSALRTWASWVEAKIDSNRTRVFFRTFEPSHWSLYVFQWSKPKFLQSDEAPIAENQREGQKSDFRNDKKGCKKHIRFQSRFCTLRLWGRSGAMLMSESGVIIRLFPIVATGVYLVFQIPGTKFSSLIYYRRTIRFIDL